MWIVNYIANKLWIALCFFQSVRFHLALNRIEEVQEKLLIKIIKQNKLTQYGKRFNFAKVSNIKTYQEYVPVTDYEVYEPYIEEIVNGAKKVLTDEQVIMFELSSGSTAPSKLVPYTASLKKQFIAGINPWIRNLYNHFRDIYKGKSYWSITPVNVRNSKTPAGIPIGFEEDSQYFGFIEKMILDFLFAVPSEVKYISNMDSFRYVTLLFLLREKRLSLISVWNPTFLILLLKPLVDWKETLINDLKYGTISSPALMEKDILDKLLKKLGKQPKRALELKGIFDSFSDPAASPCRTLYERVWPKLRLISCWTDANAGIYIEELVKLFPHVAIQGKGLIATEGFVSVPFVGEEGARLSIRSHFFEFEEIGLNGEKTGLIRLAHELAEGKRYSLILTTGGGFYRYRLHDIVKVTGFTGRCPRIKFAGKEGKISDLVGEKLNEYHVRRVIDNAFEKISLKPFFYLLSPEADDTDAFYYVLFVEIGLDIEVKDEVLKGLISRVDEGLSENFHYRYCRNIGQLKHARLFKVDSKEGYRGIEVYHKVCRSCGQRDGNIKIYALHNRPGWIKEFKGRLVKVEEEGTD